ncbi:transmembrane and ubiquitin-like domain-containing protein 1 isoform X1 [Chiloscyllium plagiosum]|uniref:transmembrane and ubiquitin-like domain-containing protein 1 isoform X1 n=2 Tax=Chiloscyllium plagiosum TaxID=36176 RepID=UPI001CB887B8|nr:transmembrane and ubiquitin-like domain-containing protein 1 isoform X1 [Chiloscyllium plagiosum]
MFQAFPVECFWQAVICVMAVIEGIGDEVTILFSLFLMVLVLVLAWASTRTVERADQELQPAEDPPVAVTQEQQTHCTSPPNHLSHQGETTSNASESECIAEEYKQSKEEEEELSEEEEEVERKESEEEEAEEEEREKRSEEEERSNHYEEVEAQEKAKGNEVEEETLAKHETSPTEKGAEGLDTDDVSELLTSPLDTAQLRQRLTSAGDGEGLETLNVGDQSSDSDCTEDSFIMLRLKFLNDTERIARVRPEDTIGEIKRIHFPQQEHQIRLIYQGQLLGDDTRTLSSLHIVNNCVIHCHISQNATPQSPAGSHAAEHTETTLNIGGLMLPIFFLMLSVLWYYQINYRQFFTAPATISLVGITILFSFVAFGAYRR